MRILVIGSGGREHALVWKLQQSPQVEEVLVAPGNAGTCLEMARNVPVAVDDLQGLVSLAVKEKVDLVVPGPELPLTLGISDAMHQVGIACFGPDAYAAQLEGSKIFAKEMMQKSAVPTARYTVCSSFAEAEQALHTMPTPLVVKAEGLAAGKGVIIAKTHDEAVQATRAMLVDGIFGQAGQRIILEECLCGEEVSLLCFCDGQRAVPLPSAQDHKAVFDGDQGPNTGGMGAYSPAPILPNAKLEELTDLTVRPILKCLQEAGHPFIGVLYAGLMLTSAGPRVLEYNVRFGDPECQPLLLRLQSDLAEIMQACTQGKLQTLNIQFTPQSALGVVLAAEGYPGKYNKDLPITGLALANALPDVKVFHSGTKLDSEGNLLSNGGRVLCVTALGKTLAEAQHQAYQALAQITMPSAFWRHDIGEKGLAHEE